MPLASIAAMPVASSKAIAAPSSAADAPENDFHSVLASYAPANDVASPPAESAPAESFRQAQPVPPKEIAPFARVRSVDRAGKMSKPSEKAEHATKDQKDEKAPQTNAVPHDAKTDVKVLTTAHLAIPVTPQVIKPPAAIAANTLTQPSVSQNSDDVAEGEATGTASPVKFDPAIAAKPYANERAHANSADARNQSAAQDEQANAPQIRSALAPQIKSADALPKRAMDAIVAAAKAQPQPAIPAAAQPTAPSNPVSIASMLNLVRGTITAMITPKQSAAPEADDKTASAAPIVDKKADAGQTQIQSAHGPAQDDATGKPAQSEDVDKFARNNATQGNASEKTAQNDVAQNNAVQSKVVPNTAVQTNAADKSAQSDQKAPQDVARDTSVTASETIAKPDAATPAPSLQSASPSVMPANQIVSAVTPNIAASSPFSPANGAQVPAQTNAQPDVQPNVAALATAIVAKSAAGTKTFDIRMDPPELGRVDVHLSVDRDGKVQALLSAEHPQTLALLQRDSQNLERSLKEAGLNLSNNSLNFSLKGEGRQGDGGGAFTARVRSLPDAVVARAEAANASEINLSSVRGNGRLDIRV